jgi:hypothetical protein
MVPGVTRHQFLPVYVGWNAVFGLRPDGSLIRWNFELEPERVSELLSPFWRRMALFQGAKKYPELTTLLPARPAVAETCRLCNGAGEIAGRDDLVCECGGAGWILTGEARDDPPG